MPRSLGSAGQVEYHLSLAAQKSVPYQPQLQSRKLWVELTLHGGWRGVEPRLATEIVGEIAIRTSDSDVEDQVEVCHESSSNESRAGTQKERWTYPD